MGKLHLDNEICEKRSESYKKQLLSYFFPFCANGFLSLNGLQ